MREVLSLRDRESWLVHRPDLSSCFRFLSDVHVASPSASEEMLG